MVCKEGAKREQRGKEKKEEKREQMVDGKKAFSLGENPLDVVLALDTLHAWN